MWIRIHSLSQMSKTIVTQIFDFEEHNSFPAHKQNRKFSTVLKINAHVPSFSNKFLVDNTGRQ